MHCMYMYMYMYALYIHVYTVYMGTIHVQYMYMCTCRVCTLLLYACRTANTVMLAPPCPSPPSSLFLSFPPPPSLLSLPLLLPPFSPPPSLPLPLCLTQWFFANYLYALALVSKSVALVNTLSSTSSVFVVVLAAIPVLHRAPGDRITLSRALVAVIR